MTQQEHLLLIRAKCVELLELAKQRTPGQWRFDGGRLRSKSGALYDIGEYGNGFGLEDADAAFIASAAGPFEAALASTVAAIDLASRETASDMPYNTFDRILDRIIASWPIELLQQ